MFATKTLAQGATALGIALTALSAPASADDQDWHYVKDMVLVSNTTPEIVVKNTAANHQLNSVDLGIQGSTIAVSVGGAVECLGTTSENAFKRHGAFLSEGAFGIGRTSLVMQKTLPDSNNINHVSDMDAKVFQLPKTLLANPAIDLDPVALVQAAADQAPDRLQYLRQDHVIMASLPIRWESTCSPYTRYKVKKETIIEAYADESFMTKDVPVKIVYKGDPQLTNLNAQVAKSVPNGGYQQAQPFKITSAQFPHEMPDHVGACPATKQFRVFYQGQGKGQLRIRIAAGNTPLHESGIIAYDSKDHTQNYAFDLGTPNGAATNKNTILTNLRVFVRSKGANENSWSGDYKLMDQAVWKIRCTPQMNPALGGAAAGGYSKDGANGNAGPTPVLPPKRATMPSEPVPALKRAQ